MTRNSPDHDGWYPCPTCCGCEYFADTFDREELGDDWNVETGGASISDGDLALNHGASTLVLCQAEHPTGHESIVVKAIATLVDDATLELIVDWTDADNYKLAEFAQDEDGLWIRLKAVTAGSATTIASTYLEGGVVENQEVIASIGGGGFCAGLTWFLTDADVKSHGYCTEPVAGLGSNGGGAEDVLVHEFDIEQHGAGKTGCQTCCDCDKCEECIIPSCIQGTFTGWPDSPSRCQCHNDVLYYLEYSGDCQWGVQAMAYQYCAGPLELNKDVATGQHYFEWSFQYGPGGILVVLQSEMLGTDEQACLEVADLVLTASEYSEGYGDVELVITAVDGDSCPLFNYACSNSAECPSETPNEIEAVISGLTGAKAAYNGTYVLTSPWREATETCVWEYDGMTLDLDVIFGYYYLTLSIPAVSCTFQTYWASRPDMRLDGFSLPVSACGGQTPTCVLSAL